MNVVLIIVIHLWTNNQPIMIPMQSVDECNKAKAIVMAQGWSEVKCAGANQ